MSERKAPNRDKQIQAIVRGATFLSERLQASRSAYTGACQGEVGEEHLARWRSALGPEGADWLEKRLRWDGFDPALAYLALDDARLPTNLVPNCATPEAALYPRNISPDQGGFQVHLGLDGLDSVNDDD